MGAAICLAFIGGCAGSGSERLAFWPQYKPATTAESPVLDFRQTADVHLALGRTAEQQKQWPAAMTIYHQMLEADPKHPEATHRLAILYARQGEFEQSSQWFQKTLKLKPGDPDVFCDIGFSLYSQGRYPEAEINLRQAIAVKPDHARAQNHLGLVLAQQGEREAVFAAFRRANCSPAQAHTNLAVILALNNHAEEARQHLQSARQYTEPDDRGLQKRLEELEVLIANRESQQSLPAWHAEAQSTAVTLASNDADMIRFRALPPVAAIQHQ
jgi:Flp pilus assembly protein TadD